MPNEADTNTFIEKVASFREKFPEKIIGVHCIHGSNLTGFLICAYLFEKKRIESKNMFIDKRKELNEAVSEFTKARPAGIYKQEYIDELFFRYADVPKVYIYLNYKFT